MNLQAQSLTRNKPKEGSKKFQQVSNNIQQVYLNIVQQVSNNDQQIHTNVVGYVFKSSANNIVPTSWCFIVLVI